MSYYRFRISRLIIVGAFAAFTSIEASLGEEGGYMVIKKIMTAAGYSDFRADCSLTIMRYTGATSDVTDIRNIINPSKLMEKLHDKAQIADFVCSPQGIVVTFIVFVFIFSFCCGCLMGCCRSKRSSDIIVIYST